MPTKKHPRGPEWKRGYQSGYRAGIKAGREHLRECRAENDRMRAELEDWKEYFEGQWESVGKHPASRFLRYVQEIEHALEGG